MKINLFATLLFSLLFTACSLKSVHKDEENNLTKEHNITHISANHPREETTSNIIATQETTQNTIQEIQSTTQPTIENSIESSVTSTQVYQELTGDFLGNQKLTYFIDRMHNEHGFSYEYLYKLFSEAKNTKYEETPCITTSDSSQNCTVAIKPKGKWERYRGMFVYERNINRGVAFWQEHEQALNRAYATYGVLPQYIVGIIGIETAYGVNFGKKRVIDVLTTKGMTGDRREDFYTNQLEKFLIMTRDSHLDAATLMGSNAGAMGYGQFIASSYLDFAVDFNGDGVTDLWNAEDAIGSVANYFARNGWNRNISQVAVRAKYRGNRFRRLKTGYKTKYSQYKLRKKYKIKPRTKLRYRGPVSLIKLPKYSYDELWFGTHNFRVITTYNHSTFYGMAVHVLGEAVKKRRYGR